MADVKLGINNYFAVKRWPEPEEWTRIIRQELDLTIAQFSLDIVDPKTSDSVRNILMDRTRESASKYGLSIHSLLTGGIATHMGLLLGPELGMRMDALQWFENSIRMAASLSCECVGGILGALSMKDFLNENRKKYLLEFYRESLHHLGYLGKQQGLKYIILEPSPVRRELPAKIDETLELYDFLNEDAPLPIKLLTDLGHACSVGASGDDLDPYAWIRKIGRLCPIIHLQQTDGISDKHWPFTKEYNKRGIIDAKRVLDAIEAAGIQEVFLILELGHTFEANEAQVLDDCKESVEYWRKAIG